MIEISIVIPCLNEEAYIETCIASLLDAELDQSKTEVFFVDGKSSDRTVEMIERYQKMYGFIHLIENEKQFTPVGMNLGIQASTGKFIFILSAHASYETAYFSKLCTYCEALHAACVGGVLKTDVKHKNSRSISIKEVLTHRFGVGNASFRTGISEVTEVDTVAFGCYRRETFEKYGFFDERLIRNQDIEFNKRLVNGGGKIFLVPDVTATYYARETFSALARNSYANGFWNMLTAYYTKKLSSLSLRHFVPLLFMLSLLLPMLLSLFSVKFLWLTLLSSLSYLCFVIIISIGLKNKTNSLRYLLMGFLTLHFSYGVGSLMGIFSSIKKYIKGKK